MEELLIDPWDHLQLPDVVEVPIQLPVLVDEEGSLGPHTWQTLKRKEFNNPVLKTHLSPTASSLVLPVLRMSRTLLLCLAWLWIFQLDVSRRGCLPAVCPSPSLLVGDP